MINLVIWLNVDFGAKKILEYIGNSLQSLNLVNV